MWEGCEDEEKKKDWKKEWARAKGEYGKIQVSRAKFQEVAKKRQEKAYTLVPVYAGVYDRVMEKIEENQDARKKGLTYDKAWQYKKLIEHLPRAQFLGQAVEQELNRQHKRIRQEKQVAQDQQKPTEKGKRWGGQQQGRGWNQRGSHTGGRWQAAPWRGSGPSRGQGRYWGRGRGRY